MQKFNDATYASLVTDLISDAFYVDGMSKRGAIAKIRQYAEIIVRKLLDLPEQEPVTLGNSKIVADLKIRTNQNSLFLSSLDQLRVIGNKCTHTQAVNDITDSDVKNCIDCLFKIYSFLYIDYFEKYRFGSNDDVVRSFSILPPIIRYITLDYLYQKDEANVAIIDKLALATLKAINKESAMNWLDSQKQKLIKMSSIAEDARLDLLEKFGPATAASLFAAAPNMYNLCVDKVTQVAATIDQHGKLYDDFESAMKLFESDGEVIGSNPDVTEFNALMKFVYLGRRAIKNEKLDDLGKYVSLM